MKELYRVLMEQYRELSANHNSSLLQELAPSQDPNMHRNQVLALKYCIDNKKLMMNTPYLIYWGQQYVDDANKPLEPNMIDGETYY
jgi:hypothetical protein